MNIIKNYREGKQVNTKTKYLKSFWGIYSQHVLLYKK